MQSLGQGHAPSCPRSAQGDETGRGRGKGRPTPGKRLYGLPTPFFAADVLPVGRLAVAARVAFPYDL